MRDYRHLTAEESAVLKGNGCRAESWDSIYVADGFRPENIVNVEFYGKVELGVFAGYVVMSGGMSVPSGVYNAALRNVSVEDNALIRNIHGYISDYDIGVGACISDAGKIFMEGQSSFGNGTGVNVLNETGGRTVTVYEGMSAQAAYFQAMYRHRESLSDIIGKIAGSQAERSESCRGTIGAYSKIEHVGMIRNVRIGERAVLHGCQRLSEGTVSGSAEDPVFMGDGIICEEFIVGQGSRIDEGAVISRTYVGQGVCLSRGFSCSDSLFFANSHCENGEAVSVFAGPFTVSHHKSTLLIGSAFSFMNAGSSANFSNHRYKLGPVHQGVFGRGVKLGSGSYMLLPVHVAPFTTVLGHHYANIDTPEMPFSYIAESEGDSCLVPGVVLMSAGLFRDAMKWPARDRRKDSSRHDHIIYNVFSPFTAGKMIAGKDILVDMLAGERISGTAARYGGCIIRFASIPKGIGRYDAALKFYIGSKIAGRLAGRTFGTDASLREALLPESSVGGGDWVDVAGLLAPKAEIDNLVEELERGEIVGIEDLEARFAGVMANYSLYEWRWVYDHIFQVYGVNPASVTRRILSVMLGQWVASSESMFAGIVKDAMKEYSEEAMTGFGPDGGELEAGMDFRNVRGTAEDNDIILKIRSVLDSIKRDAESIALSL